MTTAFVLSGGGSVGAVQAGMLQALAARGIEPDLLVGRHCTERCVTTRARAPSSSR